MLINILFLKLKIEGRVSMEAEYYVGSRQSLKKILNELKSRGLKVLGPKKSGGSIVYGEISDMEEMPLGIGGLSSITHHSIKEILHPSNQRFLYTDSNYTSHIPENGTESFALFGIRPCDLSSLQITDLLLSEDPFYNNRRSKLTWVIVEECQEPGIYCFCSLIGTGPTAKADFDISYALIGRDCVVFRKGTEKGEKMLKSLQLKEVDENSKEVLLYKQRAEAAAVSMKKRFRESLSGLPEALDASLGDVSFWKKISDRCIGCSNCNMVCPTCTCSEFLDEAMMDGSAERQRFWVGCLSPVYGEVAGTHFRKEQYMRYRHFVLHKFLFPFIKQVPSGCVGCGRCIAFCPMGLDLRNTLQEVLIKYAKK
jgi:ferredoxin